MSSNTVSVELFTYDYCHAMREVGGSNPGRGTIVGGVFHPTGQLAKFSPTNMSYILNSKFISN